MAKTKHLSLKTKTKAKDSTLKAKTKDMAYCPPGTLRSRTCLEDPTLDIISENILGVG